VKGGNPDHAREANLASKVEGNALLRIRRWQIQKRKMRTDKLQIVAVPTIVDISAKGSGCQTSTARQTTVIPAQTDAIPLHTSEKDHHLRNHGNAYLSLPIK